MREGKASPIFGHRGMHNVCLGGSDPLLIKLYGPDDSVLAMLTEERGECIDPGYVDFFLGPNCRRRSSRDTSSKSCPMEPPVVLHDDPETLARDRVKWIAFLESWVNRHEFKAS
jgi:hypothetical protein